MLLGKLSAIRFKPITHTPQVQRRIKLAQEALALEPGESLGSSQHYLAAQKIAEKIPAEVSDRLGMYLCFGGDISTFVAATGLTSFVGLDCRPLFNDQKIDSYDSSMGVSLPQRLINSALNKWAHGFLHNDFIVSVDEVGAFMFLDLLAAGAKNLEVFAAQDREDLYSLTFDLRNGQYKVYFHERMIREGSMLEAIESNDIRIIMIKGGRKSNATCAYLTLHDAAEALPRETLIISDQELDSPFLKTETHDLGQAKFGYREGQVFISRVQPYPRRV